MKQSPEERAAAAVAELRAVTRAAHEAAQELRAAMREARTQVDGYLHDGVQRALDQYTAMIQEQIDKAVKILDMTTVARLNQMKTALQRVADNHIGVYVALARHMDLGTSLPENGMMQHRLLVESAVARITEAYGAAGLSMTGWQDSPEVLAWLEEVKKPS